MNPNRVGILLYRELVQGPKNFIFIFAVVVPLVLSFVLSLLFGTLFAGKPRLGIFDAGASQFTAAAAATEAFTLRRYADEAALRDAAAIGAIDIGIVLPAAFDAQVATGAPTTMTAYVWGESLMRDRAVLVAAMTAWVRDIAGQTSPLDVQTIVLGNEPALPWEDRLLPFVVLMSVMLGGMMLPASSLVTEKEGRTLTALMVTPTTMGDIYVAKGLLGVLISTLMALVILALNRALGGNTLLLTGVLALGAIFAAELGVLLGGLVKDINSLFAAIKSIGIILYAPALIAMFPEIPQWIARIFPTYYLIQPVIEIAQHGAGFNEIAGQLGVLVLLIGALGAGLALLTQRMRTVA
jgi:ABC-2 type transport system permease protein